MIGRLDAARQRRWIRYSGSAVVVLVSVLSLWVAIRTERANQKMVDANYRMVAASSWPFLQLASGNADQDGVPTVTLELHNAGVGPAKVETFELFWQGKAYPNVKTLLEACCNNPKVRTWAVGTAPSNDFVLRAGDSKQFIVFPRRDESQSMWDRFDRVRFAELSYRVCYCSVFDECWITNLTGLNPKRVSNCQAPAVPFGELRSVSRAAAPGVRP